MGIVSKTMYLKDCCFDLQAFTHLEIDLHCSIVTLQPYSIIKLRRSSSAATQHEYGLAFSSVADNRRLLERNVPGDDDKREPDMD